MSLSTCSLVLVPYACWNTFYIIKTGPWPENGPRSLAIYVNIHGRSERERERERERESVLCYTLCDSVGCWSLHNIGLSLLLSVNAVLLGLRDRSTRATNNAVVNTQNWVSNYSTNTNHTIIKAEMRKKMHLNSLVASTCLSLYMFCSCCCLHLRLSWFYKNHWCLDPSEKNEWKLTGKMNRMRNDRG